jgi:hypothetical protein
MCDGQWYDLARRHLRWVHFRMGELLRLLDAIEFSEASIRGCGRKRN